MTYLMSFLLAALAAPQAWSKICPENLKVSFGKAYDVDEAAEFLTAYENNNFDLKRIKGKKICHYKGLPGFQVKILNYKNPIIEISNSDAELYQPLNEEFAFNKTNIEFPVYKWIFDDDGCSFGQVSCDEFPVQVGRAYFRFVKVIPVY